MQSSIWHHIAIFLVAAGTALFILSPTTVTSSPDQLLRVGLTTRNFFRPLHTGLDNLFKTKLVPEASHNVSVVIGVAIKEAVFEMMELNTGQNIYYDEDKDSDVENDTKLSQSEKKMKYAENRIVKVATSLARELEDDVENIVAEWKTATKNVVKIVRETLEKELALKEGLGDTCSSLRLAIPNVYVPVFTEFRHRFHNTITSPYRLQQFIAKAIKAKLGKTLDKNEQQELKTTIEMRSLPGLVELEAEAAHVFLEGFWEVLSGLLDTSVGKECLAERP